jgi:serine/threonine-protein kinase
VVGSPLYMSPEQAKNSPDIDSRTDVWSLGVALFEALSGHHPWQGRGSVGELIVAICTEALPHIQDHAPWVPQKLAEVVHRAMSREPAERFQSMADLEKALEPFADGPPEIAYEQLQPVPQQQRARVATRLEDRQRSTSAALSLAQTVTALPKQSNRPLLLGAAAVVVLGTAAGLYVAFGSLTASDGVGAEAPSAAPAASSVASASSAFQVFVTVEPATATVAVGGQDQDLQDGRLVLRGGPGQSFQVTVTDGDRSIEQTVVVTADGQASPNRIELPKPAASTSPGTKPPPVAGGPGPKATGAGSASAAPTPAKPPTKPRELTTDTWK